MSSTIIYSINPGLGHDELRTLRNSYGSAPVIWDYLVRRYISRDTVFVLLPNEGAALWELAKREDIPQHLRNVLRMTFDHALVYRKDYARAAADIRAFLVDVDKNYRGVNHWPEIAALFESNPDIPAIGFGWTTVCSDPFQGQWNEEKEDHDPFDWTQAWDLYGYIDSLAAEPAEG